MKAKTLFKTLTLILALCAVFAVVCAAQEPDAKIFRFDGMGNVNVQYTNDKVIDYEYTGDGTLRMNITNAQIKAHVGDNEAISQPRFTIGDDEKFNLYDYPYVKIKFRFTAPCSVIFYPTSSHNGGYIYSMLSDNGYRNPSWHVAEFAIPTDAGAKGSYAEADRDGVTWKIGDDGVGTFPTADKPLPVTQTFMQVKCSKAQLEQIGDKDMYLEIEYIGYFKTKQDMEAYDSERSARISSYGDNGDTKFDIPVQNGEPFSVTDDGLFHIVLNGYRAPDNGSHFPIQMSFASAFDLYDYPFIKFKLTTDFDCAIQYYIEPGSGSKKYYLADIVGAGSAINGHLGQPFTFEVKIPTDGSTAAQNYEDSYGNNLSVRLAGESAFPSESYRVPMKRWDSSFFQFKYAEIPAGQSKYVDFDYVAFFNSEEEMLAYDSEQADNVKAAVEQVIGNLKAYTYTVHPNTTEDDIASYVQSQVENIATDVVVTAVTDNYVADADTCKVIVTLADGVASKELGFTVKLTKIDEFEVETLGAQIRTDGTVGLRFGAKMATATFENQAVTEVGMVVIPTAMLKGAQLTAETEDAAIVKQQVLFDDQADYKTYTAVVTGIPDNRQDAEITARPYIKYTANGQEYYYYGEAVSRSMDSVRSLSGWNK